MKEYEEYAQEYEISKSFEILSLSIIMLTKLLNILKNLLKRIIIYLLNLPCSLIIIINFFFAVIVCRSQ